MRLNIDRMDRHRVLAGFTKRSLARAVNVSEATIYRLFAGKSRSPGLIRKVCEAIGLPTSEAYQVGEVQS